MREEKKRKKIWINSMQSIEVKQEKIGQKKERKWMGSRQSFSVFFMNENFGQDKKKLKQKFIYRIELWVC